MAAAGLALMGLAGLGLLLTSGSGSGAAAAPVVPPGGGGDANPANVCSQAIANLPAELRPLVLQAWSLSAGGNAASMVAAGVPGQLESQAGVLEAAALAAPDAQKGNLKAVAKCLRDRAAAIKTTAAGGGGGGGEKEKVPPGTFPSTVLIPGTMSPPKVGTPGGGKPIVDPDGVPSSWDGQEPYKGVASNPYFSWQRVIVAGDSPARIVEQVFGADSIPRRSELIARNPKELYGRTLGSVGTPGTNGYNFASLNPNDVLVFPRAWNPWVDQMGYPKHGPIPFPQPDGSTAPTPAPPKPFGGTLT